MADRLSGGLPDVDADVVAVGEASSSYVAADLSYESPNGCLLHRAEREEIRFVATGNDQRMTACQRKAICEGGGQSVGGDQFVAIGVLAHGAGHRA